MSGGTNLEEAIRDVEQGLALRAGAGTGKTHSLSERYWAFLEARMSPLEIVAVTFTERAALELRHRLREQIMGRELPHKERILAELEAAPIGTLHALAARICREFPEEAGVPADFQVMDDLEALLLEEEWLEEVLDEVLDSGDYQEVLEAVGLEGLRATLQQALADPLGAEEALEGYEQLREKLYKARWKEVLEPLRGLEGLGTTPLGEVLGRASLKDLKSLEEVTSALQGVDLRANPWRSLDRGIREALKEAKQRARLPNRADERMKEIWPALQELFHEVREALEARKRWARRLGYADLEVHALRALERPEVQAHYQERFRRLLLDEAQDTNPVQERILKALFPDPNRWTVVGDLNQSIYGFRRADPRVMENLFKEVGRVLSLDTSYRYHPTLAEFHNAFFRNRLGEAYTPVGSAKASGTRNGSPPHYFQGSLEEQARFIAQEVRRLKEEGFSLGDVVVLGYRWDTLERVAEWLNSCGVPAVVARGGNLLETRVFLDAYLALRFLADPGDEEALLGVLRAPFFALTDKELRRLAEARGEEEGLWEALCRTEGLSPEAGRARKVLKELLGRKALEPPSRLLQRLDGETGYTGVMAALPQGARWVKDWEGVLDLVRRLEAGAEEVFWVVRRLRALLRAEAEVPRPPLQAGNALTLLTVHSAKGLEWPVVFVLDVGGWKGRRREKTSPLFRAGLALVPPVLEGNTPSLYFELAKEVLEKEENAEKERLLYVAATRAEERLYLLLTRSDSEEVEALKANLEKAGAEAASLIEAGGGVEEVGLGPEPEIRAEPLDFLPLENLPISILAYRDLEAARARLLGEPREVGAPDELELEIQEEGRGGPLVGNMVHYLLERLEREEDFREKAFRLLEEGYPEAGPEEREEALDLALRFLTEEAFAPFRQGRVAKEVPLVLELDGVRLEGRADRVGDDCLDYKTDREVDLEAYTLQVGLYALALRKERAYVADLRQRRLHEVSLAGVEEKAREFLRRLRGG